MSQSVRYRPNVAAILQRADGRILIAERTNLVDAWQFPQGGIQGDESAEDAMVRELKEELGLDPVDIELVESHGPYRYQFVPGRKKEGYDGQEQTYFLVRLLAPENKINLGTEHPEFMNFRWILPKEFQLKWLPEMKRPVYRSVFMDFFHLNLPEI